MKKVFLLAAAFAASAFMFTSCSSDDDGMGAPVITFNSQSSTKVADDGTLLVAGAVTTEKSDAELSSVTITCVYGTDGQENSATITKGITKVDKNHYTFTFDQTTPGIAEHLSNIKAIKVVAVVKDGETGTRSHSIAPAGGVIPETNLTDATTFYLGYPSSATNPVSAMGITYVSNPTSTTAKFTATKMVMLTEGLYNAIATKEMLAAAFVASSVTEFTATADAGFSAKYFIVQDGSTLRLVKMTALNFSAGNNKATFTERH